jgi:hypothetical protein
MTLYRYIPFPLILKENNDSVVVDILHQKGRDHLVLTDQQEFHTEVSEDELTRMCFLIDRMRICDDLGALTTQPADTCLGALYTGQMAPVSARCVTTLSNRDWAVERTGVGQYLVYSKETHLVKVVCGNGTSTAISVTGYQTFEVDVGCGISSAKFVINPSRILDVRASVSMQLPWYIPDLLEGRSIAQVVEARNGLVAKSVRPEEGVAALLDQAVAWSPDQENLQTHVFSATSVLAVVLMVVILAGLCYRYRRASAPPTS